MTKVSVRSARWHLNLKIAGGDLVRSADEAADRSDQTIGEGEAEPDGREQHGEREKHENSGETQLKAVPMRFEARPDVGNERRIFRDLGRQRVDPSRSVQELAFGSRNRPNANEDVADPEESAERFTIDGVLKVRRLRFGDPLLVRPLCDNDRSSVVFHERSS